MDLGTFRAMAGRMPRRNRLARAAWVSLLVACAGAEKASARPDANPGLLADDLARAMADAAAHATDQEMDLLLHNPGDDAVLRGPPPAEGCGVITPRFGAALAWCRAWGLPLATAAPPLQAALYHVLETALSPGGYQIVLAIMNRQRLLAEQEDFAAPASEAWVDDVYAQYNATGQLVELEDVALYSNVTHRLVGGTFTSNTSSLSSNRLQWQWGGAGLEGRVKQWDDYALALFGSSATFDEGDIGLRFEGHHVSLNIFIKRNGTTVQGTPYVTPLFLGAAPMLVTPAPNDPTMTYADSTWRWKQGQTLLTNLASAVRGFLQAIPSEAREAAAIPVEQLLLADGVVSVPPMNLTSPPSWMVVSLSADAPNTTAFFASHPSVALEISELTAVAKHRLGQLFEAFADIPDSSAAVGLAHAYSAVETLTLSWTSGDALEDPWSPLWFLIEAGPPPGTDDGGSALIIEYLQTEQFQVSEDGVVANHVHAMMRHAHDANPMHAHHHAEHSG